MNTRNSVVSAGVGHEVSLFSSDDIYLFNEGRNYRAYNQLGAHPRSFEGEAGTSFSVWAPNASRVSVIGDFNDWNRDTHVLVPRGTSGVWEGFIPAVGKGSLYKFHIDSQQQGYASEKADPFGIYHEKP